MLTWSDWFSEPRSNRYNYATRFARSLPVLFVQPDFQGKGFRFERTELPDIHVLHVSDEYGPAQSAILFQVLSLTGFKRPLLWIYNCLFRDFVEKCSAFKVYHATEDYFSEGICSDPGSLAAVRRELKETLPLADLVVAVSKGVLKSCEHNCKNLPDCLLLENGCDFAFWSEATRNPEARTNPEESVILYQGGINSRLDFELMDRVTEQLPECHFVFCGKKGTTPPLWDQICSRQNVEYLGQIELETVRDIASRAHAGIIPFLLNDLTKGIFPLKAFEYVACGLPVISTRVPELAEHSDVIDFASHPDEFIALLRKAPAKRNDRTAISRRLAKAGNHDYDLKFNILLEYLDKLTREHTPCSLDGLPAPHTTIEDLIKTGELAFVSLPDPNLRMARLLDKLFSRGIRRVALYGAGTHTSKVASALASSPMEIAGLVDDHPDASRGLFHLPQVVPDDVCSLGKIDAVIISSDSMEHLLYEKAKTWVNRNVNIFTLYST